MRTGEPRPSRRPPWAPDAHNHRPFDPPCAEVRVGGVVFGACMAEEGRRAYAAVVALLDAAYAEAEAEACGRPPPPPPVRGRPPPGPDDPRVAADVRDDWHAHLRALIGAHPLSDFSP